MLHSLLSSLPDLVDEHDGEGNDFCSNVDSVGNVSRTEEEVAIEPMVTGPANIHLPENGQTPSATASRMQQAKTIPADVEGALVVSEMLTHKEETNDEGEPALKEGSNLSDSSTLPLQDTVPETHAADHAPSAPKPHVSSRSRSSSASSSISHLRRPLVSLSSILTHADHLYTLYPPTHPSLAVSSIMGPQSVIHTWSEDAGKMEGDDEAEGMVGDLGSVVLSYESESEAGSGSENEDEAGEKEGPSEAEEEEYEDDEDQTSTRSRGRRGRGRRRLTKRRPAPKPKNKGGVLGSVDRKTVLAGMVLVVGVALAVYGVQTTSGTGSRHEADWKRLGKLIGGASERIFAFGGLELARMNNTPRAFSVLFIP